MASWHRLSKSLIQDLNSALTFEGGPGDPSSAKGSLSQHRCPCAFARKEVVLQSFHMRGQSVAAVPENFTGHDQIHGDI
eukprot:1939172-Amphidinium_carterae.2